MIQRGMPGGVIPKEVFSIIGFQGSGIKIYIYINNLIY